MKRRGYIRECVYVLVRGIASYANEHRAFAGNESNRRSHSATVGGGAGLQSTHVGPVRSVTIYTLSCTRCLYMGHAAWKLYLHLCSCLKLVDLKSLLKKIQVQKCAPTRASTRVKATRCIVLKKKKKKGLVLV